MRAVEHAIQHGPPQSLRSGVDGERIATSPHEVSRAMAWSARPARFAHMHPALGKAQTPVARPSDPLHAGWPCRLSEARPLGPTYRSEIDANPGARRGQEQGLGWVGTRRGQVPFPQCREPLVHVPPARLPRPQNPAAESHRSTRVGLRARRSRVPGRRSMAPTLDALLPRCLDAFPPYFKFRSNSSKIRRYSSYQLASSTNPCGSTGYAATSQPLLRSSMRRCARRTVSW